MGVDELPPLAAVLVVGTAASLLYGGAQYAVFAALMLRWMRRAPEPRLRQAVLAAPLLFAPLLGAGLERRGTITHEA